MNGPLGVSFYELGVASGDGVVGEGQVGAVAANDGGCMGDLEGVSLVRALQYLETGHGVFLSLGSGLGVGGTQNSAHTDDV